MPEDVIIPDPDELERLKHKISIAGAEKLHVIADFDKTLTKAFVDGKKIPSVISVLRDGNYLTDDYAGKAHALFDKYHPIEIDPDIPIEDKKKAMCDWWTTHFNLLIRSGLNRKDIEKAIRSEMIQLRDGALEFLETLHKHDIPLIILSSNGLGGDSISMYLKKKKCMYDNIHIISNIYEWDDDGNAICIRKPIITSMNKDETAIRDMPVFNIIRDRKNVILLGDNLEDARMAEGLDHSSLIRIGFLNQDTEKNRDAYKRSFDVVIMDDSGMGYINSLLKDILKQK